MDWKENSTTDKDGKFQPIAAVVERTGELFKRDHWLLSTPCDMNKASELNRMTGDSWTPGATYEDIPSLDIVMEDVARMDMAKGVKSLIYQDLGFSHSEWLDDVLLFQIPQFN